MFRLKRHFLVLGVWVLSLALLAGCGGKDETAPTVPLDTRPPTVTVNQPFNQALIQAGQAVQVDVVASDDQAVARIELYVDSSLVESRVAPSGSVLTTMRELFTWSASMIGPHTLQARAYDAAGQMGASSIVAVEVQSPGMPPAGPTGSPPAEATSPPLETAAPPTVPPEPTAIPTLEQALVTSNTNANVRGGPGTNYHVVGGLKEGESALVTGRNADSSWWQISFQGGTAWVANSVVAASSQAYDMPVVSAPPPPPTSTPVPPTAIPAPTNTPVPTTGFRADLTTLSAGQCTTLRWNFSGIKAIYVVFGFGYGEEGVPGYGSREVCPSVTTTYKARVVKQDNTEESHEVTINVSGSGCGDPVVQRFVPTAYNVGANEKFSIHWDVECAKGVWFIQGDGPEESVAGHYRKIDVQISADTTFKLKIEKNSGGFVYASFRVRVQ